MKTNPSLRIFKFSTLVLFAAVVAALYLIPVTSRAQIFVTNEGNNTVGEYNATTGATINSSFISSGLNGPSGIVVSSSVPEASPTLPLLLLGIGATFGLNLLLQRRSDA
jgi:hypothetical protein